MRIAYVYTSIFDQKKEEVNGLMKLINETPTSMQSLHLFSFAKFIKTSKLYA